MVLKDWKKNKYNNFGDSWIKNVNRPNDVNCGHSERQGTYCEHCELGTKQIELMVLDDQSIGSPNYGLWYVAVTGIGKKWFKTKKQSIDYAKDYMRKN